MSDEACRCGHPAGSTEPHPCHSKHYGCRKPATQRFYHAVPIALAGQGLKFGVHETWACDECFEPFKEQLVDADKQT